MRCMMMFAVMFTLLFPVIAHAAAQEDTPQVTLSLEDVKTCRKKALDAQAAAQKVEKKPDIRVTVSVYRECYKAKEQELITAAIEKKKDDAKNKTKKSPAKSD